MSVNCLKIRVGELSCSPLDKRNITRKTSTLLRSKSTQEMLPVRMNIQLKHVLSFSDIEALFLRLSMRFRTEESVSFL